MKKTLSKTILVVFAFFVASCASYKNFDFKTAYKFDRINYNKSVSSNSNKVDIIHDTNNKPVYLSSEGLPEELAPILSYQINEERYAGHNPISVDKNHEQDLVELKSTYKEMNRVERKQLRKELRQTIQDIRNEGVYPDILLADIGGIAATQADDSSNKKRKIARYLLIGGGALVIIAVIVGSVSVVGTIGVVAVIAGAVLMLLSLDKSG